MTKRGSVPFPRMARREGSTLRDVAEAREAVVAAHELGTLAGAAAWEDREWQVDEVLDRMAAAPIEGPADHGARDALSWLVAGEAAVALREQANRACTDTEDGIAMADRDRLCRRGCAPAFPSRRRVSACAIHLVSC
jgi:hypothetical protein